MASGPQVGRGGEAKGPRGEERIWGYYAPASAESTQRHKSDSGPSVKGVRLSTRACPRHAHHSSQRWMSVVPASLSPSLHPFSPSFHPPILASFHQSIHRSVNF